jgi:hypothetical protein
MMAALDRLGRFLASFWLALLGLALLLSFPICGFIASCAVGAGVAMLIGGGTPGAVAFFVVAFLFGLFLSVFVWPHVKDAVSDSIERFTKSGSG